MKQRQQLLFSLFAICFIASAQSQAAEELETVEDFAPPAITNEDLTKPEITVIEKDGDVIEEYRVNGQLYMMKITPKHGKPYYMHKEDQEGGWTMIGPNEPLSVPKWTLFTF